MDKIGSVDYFNDIAKDWDNMRRDFFTEQVRESALNKAGVEQGKTGADIGAGSGFVSEALIKRGIKTIAVDQSDEMVKLLKEKFSGIEALQGDSENLPIESESVDYAFANMYLHHVENPFKSIKEMARILKTNGKLVITDLDEHDFEFLKTEQYDRWMGFKREEVKGWFEVAGLSNVTVECTGESCCADSSCGCSSAKISIFMAYGEKK